MAVQLEEKLRKTDKACDTWARERRPSSGGTTNPLHNLALVKAGVVLEGPQEMSDTSMFVDRIYLTSDAKEKSLLVVWYVDQRTPITIKARKIGIARSQIYVEWKHLLQYVRGRLLGFGIDV